MAYTDFLIALFFFSCMGGLNGLSYIPLTFHQIPWSYHEYMSCLSVVVARREGEFHLLR